MNRRSFLTTAAVATAPSVVAAVDTSASPESKAVSLNGRWTFRLDPDARGESDGWQRHDTPVQGWRAVDVPHTWQIEPRTPEYMGLGWYRRAFEAPAWWARRRSAWSSKPCSILRPSG